MKTSKLYILLLSTLAFASCTKEMTEGLDEVNVSVVTSETVTAEGSIITCLLYTSPSPRDKRQSRMPSSA